MPNNTLFLIDVQNDFHPGGSLAVPGSDEDAARLVSFINKNSSSIDRIIVTLDTHHRIDMSHPRFWISIEEDKKSEKIHPPPFTVIKNEDIGTKWKPRDDLDLGEYTIDHNLFANKSIHSNDGKLDLVMYCKEYTSILEQQGRFVHCIWPEHCLIGTAGHNVYAPIQEALLDWEDKHRRNVMYCNKGDHILTESYSVFQAEVPVNQQTSFNFELFDHLRKSDKIWVCGQALSHCVNYSVRDLVEKWPKEERSKIHLLKNCTSPVPTFEEPSNKFLKDMEDAGIVVTEVFAIN